MIKLNQGIDIADAQLGSTYQINDQTSYWNNSFGRCIAIHRDRREITLHVDNHPVTVKPEELRFVCK